MENLEKLKTGDRIKELMQQRGIKQRDILEMVTPLCQKYNVKISKADLSQYVNNKSEPRQDKLYLLAQALKVSEGWLMGFDVDQTIRKDTIDITDALDGDKKLIYKNRLVETQYVEILKKILN